MNRKRNQVAERVARCAALIKAKPRTTKELCELMEITNNEQGRATVSKYLKALQAEGFIEPDGFQDEVCLTQPRPFILWAWRK